MTRSTRFASLGLRGIAAFILLQTLFFKFTAAPESVYVFRALGAEPWGRIASGVVEGVAAVLLLWPGRTAWGAALAAAVMVGAIASHLGPLGIVVQDDGGLLFGLALTVLGASLSLLALHRDQLRLPGASRRGAQNDTL